MAVAPIPSDPRTWDDFTNLEPRGFTKIDRDTPLEGWSLFAGFVLTALGAFWCYGTYAPSDPARAGGMAALLNDWHPVAIFVAGLACFAVRLLTDNFYLIDSARHAIYYHFEFAWYRRVRLLLERKDILGATVQSRWRSSRYGRVRTGFKYSWYEHRTVLIDTRGGIVPLSEWMPEDLWSCNNEACDLSKKLDCTWFEMPDDSRLIVKRSGGAVDVRFGPANWFIQPDLASRAWLIGVLAIIVVGGIAMFMK